MKAAGGTPRTVPQLQYLGVPKHRLFDRHSEAPESRRFDSRLGLSWSLLGRVRGGVAPGVGDTWSEVRYLDCLRRSDNSADGRAMTLACGEAASCMPSWFEGETVCESGYARSCVDCKSFWCGEHRRAEIQSVSLLQAEG